jgi:hypothetical protein
MKRLLILLCLTSCFYAFAQQEWAPKGATWYYNASSSDYWKEGFIKIEYIGDTIIEQKKCKLLQEQIITYDYIFHEVDSGVGSTQITYYENNILYFYRFNTFFKIFDFNASIGDSWKIPSFENRPQCDSTGYVIVDSIGSTIINSDTLKYLSLSIKQGSQLGYIGRAIEKIGSLTWMYPVYIACYFDAGGGSGLRCYKDDNYYYKNGTVACEALPTDIKDDRKFSTVKLYPNPVFKQLKLLIPDILIRECSQVIIVTLAGNELARYPVTGDMINVEALPPGIYFAKIIFKSSISIAKFIKL